MQSLRPGTTGLGLVLVLPGLVVGAALAQRAPVFRAQIGIVVLQATVKNGRGELITNLDRDAFRVYENGREQEVSLFRRNDVPVSLGIAIDNSGSVRDKRAKLEAAALALVRASNPRDEVFLISFGDKPHIDVPLTRDVGALEAGIRRTDSIGGTALRDAIEAGCAYLSGSGRHDRKVLLVVTDGNDNASAAPASRIREQAERSQIVIHAIGLLNDQDPAKARRARRELDALTEMTGGLAYFPRRLEEVEPVALDLARQIRSQYTIGYSPANQALDGSYRKVRVVVRGPQRLSVRTRTGYRATPALAAPGPSMPSGPTQGHSEGGRRDETPTP